MTDPDPAMNTKAALIRRAKIAIWKWTYGEPPAVVAKPRIMMNIIQEHAAQRCCTNTERGSPNEPRR